MKITLFIFLLSLNANLLAKVTNLQPNCFTRHLKEAIHLNHERKLLYANMSQNKSLEVSNTLIGLEKLTTIFSSYFDQRAFRYQKEGLNILCDEFVSMELTPPIQTKVILPNIKFSEVTKPNWKKIKNEVKSLVKVNQFDLAMNVLEIEIKRYKPYPYYCMYKHLLESLLKSVSLMASYQSWDEIHNDNALLFSKRIFNFQLMGMWPGVLLDKKASKVQEMGINIICQDVPPIIF